MTFVALWLMRFVGYDVCRFMMFFWYEYMMFVLIWRLSLTTFVALWRLAPIMTFVACRVCRSIIPSSLSNICTVHIVLVLSPIILSFTVLSRSPSTSIYRYLVYPALFLCIPSLPFLLSLPVPSIFSYFYVYLSLLFSLSLPVFPVSLPHSLFYLSIFLFIPFSSAASEQSSFVK